jgi:hypothetical protein
MASSDASKGDMSATGVDDDVSFVGVLDLPPNIFRYRSVISDRV